MYLFFDTETTGLPRRWDAPASDLRNWPRLVQLAWLLCDENGNELEAKDYIVKPEGFSIPADASDIHRISNEKAVSEGVVLGLVLKEFLAVVNQAKVLVAHNMSFDGNVLEAELIRTGLTGVLSGISKICTKISSTDYCRLPGDYGRYKWPTLQELHFVLFQSNFEEAHNAMIDVQICAKCFFELNRLGVAGLEISS